MLLLLEGLYASKYTGTSQQLQVAPDRMLKPADQLRNVLGLQGPTKLSL